MLIGHEDKIKIFKTLVEKNNLSHGYLFFGEPNVGKTTFALALANLIEKGEFNKPDLILSESKLIQIEEGSIGIDQIREIKHFLSQKPVSSSRRVVIIEQAGKLTSQAQNAVLKIAEEPPASGLIILTANNPDVLLATLRSRLQLVYFGRVLEKEIVSLLEKEYGVPNKKAQEVASVSLGKPGRAVSIIEDDRSKEGVDLVNKFLKGSETRRSVAEKLAEQTDLLDIFVSYLLAELSKDTLANHQLMSKLLGRVSMMEDFSTNKRLQIESALWQS